MLGEGGGKRGDGKCVFLPEGEEIRQLFRIEEGGGKKSLHSTPAWTG